MKEKHPEHYNERDRKALWGIYNLENDGMTTDDPIMVPARLSRLFHKKELVK